jgi:hypothetical protein
MVVLFFVTLATAQLPQFEFQGKLECNGQEITDISWPSSCVTDWDGDGLKDLIIGEFSPNGKVRFYKNIATNTAPEFESYSYIKANGVDIKLTTG